MKKLVSLTAIALVSGLGIFAAQAQPSGMSKETHESHHQGEGATGGMMEGKMMGGGMMGGGMMSGMMGGGMGKMMLAMMDADDDGALSLEEFQAVHARMFKAMDSDGDGRLSAEELGSVCGGSAPETSGAE